MVEVEIIHLFACDAESASVTSDTKSMTVSTCILTVVISLSCQPKD